MEFAFFFFNSKLLYPATWSRINCQEKGQMMYLVISIIRHKFYVNAMIIFWGSGEAGSGYLSLIIKMG